MSRRLVPLGLGSLIVSVIAVIALPTNRTAILRVEVLVLATLVGAALVGTALHRVPVPPPPERGRHPSDVPVPAAVASLALSFRLALSAHPHAQASGQHRLRDDLRAIGAREEQLDPLPTTVAGWDDLLDVIATESSR